MNELANSAKYMFSKWSGAYGAPLSGADKLYL